VALEAGECTIVFRLKKVVDKGEGTTSFDNAQGFPKHRSLVGDRANLVEREIAHGPVKLFRCELQGCRVPLLEPDAVGDLRDSGVLLAPCPGILPLRPPVINGQNLCFGVLDGELDCEDAVSGSNIKISSREIDAQCSDDAIVEPLLQLPTILRETDVGVEWEEEANKEDSEDDPKGDMVDDASWNEEQGTRG